MTAAVFPARLKIQHLQTVKAHALKSGSSWEGSISLPQAATELLLWWCTHLQQWNGLSWTATNPQAEIYTDASDSE
ncbi:hypothetical protein BC939DRAFT_447198 [Gamsiella multidivaricata]|uniref:uncharacterized protein n=1 Tax=Gamsiella multidivaricata TaxID=101098 RepID=UPI00221E3D44|nr:uncharacterized protein BC939DRAFT_447198 [Gamsiella multidivaricata]KAI7826194.1 hypothetical protein BC939DRAFT_447198 [Gamsiella multidivaricata]